MTGPLRDQLADYLTLRRALGYRLERPEKLLNQFLEHLEHHGEEVITVAGGSSADSLAGILAVGNAANAATQGEWQYFNGTSWVNIGARTRTPATCVSKARSNSPA